MPYYVGIRDVNLQLSPLIPGPASLGVCSGVLWSFVSADSLSLPDKLILLEAMLADYSRNCLLVYMGKKTDLAVASNYSRIMSTRGSYNDMARAVSELVRFPVNTSTMLARRGRIDSGGRRTDVS